MQLIKRLAALVDRESTAGCDEAGADLLSTTPLASPLLCGGPDNVHGTAAGISHLEYSDLQLVPIHEHLILGTPEFWEHIAPDDAVLRSHLYLKVCPDVCSFVLEIAPVKECLQVC